MLTSTKSGFTLIEVLAAMVIMLVGLLGLLQAINVAVDHNTRNHLREEATGVGERVMSEFRVKPFELMSAVYPRQLVASKLRGYAKNYVVYRTSRDISAGSKELQVVVKWAYRNVTTQQMVKSIRTQ